MRSARLRDLFFRRGAVAVLAAALGLALVAWALQVVRVAPEVLTGATPAGLSARVVLLPLLPILAFVWPVALGAGILIAGRRLATEGAFAALAAAGIAPRRLLQPFLVLAAAGAAAAAALALWGEPAAFAGLRGAAPDLAVAAFAGRAAPGALVPAGPGAELFVAARAGDAYRDALIVRRDATGATVELAARELRLDGTVPGVLALVLRDGALRSAGPDGVATAGFSALRLPFDVALLRRRIESMLPAGLAAPPRAAFAPAACGVTGTRELYLVLRRWTAPLQALLFGLLAACLAVRGTAGARAALALAAAVVLTHALARLLEPAAGAAPAAVAAALFVPYVPLAALLCWAGARLYLPESLC